MASSIKIMRAGKNWTQTQLAEKLGVDQKLVSLWENGYKVRPKYRERLLKVLGEDK